MGGNVDQQLISIIVAAYNVGKFLDCCIKSLVEQTYPYLEIILVDDGSTDTTGKICDDWARRDRRIKVLHKKNGGISDTRNAGICQARGKWIGFVDGDDYVSATMYEHLYQQRTEQGITVCGFLIEENGNTRQCSGIEAELQPQEAVDLYLSNELYSRIYRGVTYWGSYPWNKLYDRGLFDQVSYPVGKKYEDAYIILDLVQKAKSIRFIPCCEYVYVQHPKSITHDISNIKNDLLSARLTQKEQLFKYWKMSDIRMEKLVAIEYFDILHRYACMFPKERDRYRETAIEAWEMLKKLGYDYFPVKLKVRLFMCVCCPSLYYLIWKAKCIIKKL